MTNNTNVQFDKLYINLRKRRKELGLTQREVAKHANISVPTYSRYENPTNKCEPKYFTMLHIAEALNTSVDELMDSNIVEKQQQKNQLLSTLYSSSSDEKLYLICKNKQYAISCKDIADIAQNIGQLIRQSTILSDKLEHLHLEPTNMDTVQSETIKNSILSMLFQKIMTA